VKTGRTEGGMIVCYSRSGGKERFREEKLKKGTLRGEVLKESSRKGEEFSEGEKGCKKGKRRGGEKDSMGIEGLW